MSQRGQDILRRIAAMPDERWQRCRRCRAVMHEERLERAAGVCPECGAYSRLSARTRIESLVDEGSFVEHELEAVPHDPLDFVDRLPYPERLARSRSLSGLTEAVVVGTARLERRAAALAVLDFAFMGGSMGMAVGGGVSRAADLALEARMPLITVASSGGARMQEGVLSLLQMVRTSTAIRGLRDAGVPFVSVLADPLYGGVAASFAALGDVILVEAGSCAGFAGPQVIEQTIRQKLPDGFQTAEFLRDHGHVDAVVERAELPSLLRRLLAVFDEACRPRAVPRAPFPAPELRAGGAVDGWQTVRMARTPGRPTALEYIDGILPGFLALSGDRWTGDDQAVVGGLAWLDDAPVMVVGSCKGRNTRQNLERNFGMPHPSGYRKATRLFALAERIGVPVITLIDTPGAYPGIAAEEGNQSGAIAEALCAGAGLRVPLVALVMGEGGSGGALALAAGDRLLMQEHAIFSVISPEGCATILFGDAGRAPEAARALRLTATELMRLGVVDEIIAEPPGGAHLDPVTAMQSVGEALARHVAQLARLAPDELVARRRRRARALGTVRRPGAARFAASSPREPARA